VSSCTFGRACHLPVDSIQSEVVVYLTTGPLTCQCNCMMPTDTVQVALLVAEIGAYGVHTSCFT
jgi:hypothetical protein